MSAIEPIHAMQAAEPLGHYSQAVRANGFIFVSGLLGVASTDDQIVVRDFDAQTRICLDNLRHILEAAGSSLSRIVKVTVYLDDVAKWAAANTIYQDVFGDHKPARAVVPTRSLHHGFEIEIDAIALAD